MRPFGWVVFVGVLSLAATASTTRFAPAPLLPPTQATPATAEDRIIRIRLSVDERVAREHGARLAGYLDEVVAIANIEWRRVRRDWFVIESVAVVPASRERDAIYLLSALVHRNVQERDTVHVGVIGGPLELYGSGAARSIGGLAFRASDTAIVSAPRGTTADLLAYYLFHELGHCWDAFDLPFSGGHSTYGSKKFATFHVDAGNAQIMEDSPGPRPRDTPGLAPSVIRAKLAAARKATKDPRLFRQLHDLLLHEPSFANGAYVAKRARLLSRAGHDRMRIASVLSRYEITPRQLREEAATRRELSERYWIASDAMARGDVAAAAEALHSIETLLAGESGDTRLLVAAVGRKVRRAGWRR